MTTDTYTAAEVRLLIQIAATLVPDNFSPDEAQAVIHKAKATMRRANDQGSVSVEILPYREPR